MSAERFEMVCVPIHPRPLKKSIDFRPSLLQIYTYIITQILHACYEFYDIIHVLLIGFEKKSNAL